MLRGLPSGKVAQRRFWKVTSLGNLGGESGLSCSQDTSLLVSGVAGWIGNMLSFSSLLLLSIPSLPSFFLLSLLPFIYYSLVGWLVGLFVSSFIHSNNSTSKKCSS